MRLTAVTALLLTVGAAIPCCSRSSVPSPVDPPVARAPEPEAASQPRIIPHFPGRGRVRVSGRAELAPFEVEVARTEGELSQGLMFRKELPDHHGMVFEMGYDRDWSFYMRNTYVRLDMIFIDADWRVVGVVENVPPLTEDSRSVGAPSRFVLELAAHEARRAGIQAGTQLAFEKLADAPAPAQDAATRSRR